MGQFKDNDATLGLSGKVGKFFTYRQRFGKTVAARQPGKRNKPGNEKQQELRERFLEASIYAKAVIENIEKKAVYEAKTAPGKGVYMLAMTDYLTPPVVKRLSAEGYTGEVGSLIKVRAKDDFKVTRVSVAIINAAGELLERGDTVLDIENGLDCVYTTTVVNDQLPGTRILATAYDLAGNTGSLEMIV